MNRKVTLLKLVVASPGDVSTERDMVETVASELNRGIAADRAVRLEVVRWETDAYPGFHADGPQGLIDPVLQINDSDILVGIFWKRFGTPTTDAGSGTEHEVRSAYHAWRNAGRPQLFIYFNQASYTPRSREETDQWGQVLQFQADFPREGLWWPYCGADDFERSIRAHLTSFLRQTYPVAAAQAGAEAPSVTLTARALGLALVGGLAAAAESVTTDVAEVLAESLDRTVDGPWARDVDAALGRWSPALRECLAGLDAEGQSLAIRSLPRLLQPTALSRIAEQAQALAPATAFVNEDALSQVWKTVLNGLGADQARLDGQLLAAADEVRESRQALAEHWAAATRLSDRLEAVLDPGRAACERHDVPYRSPHMLHALLSLPDSFAAKCFDEAQPGLAATVRTGCSRFIEEQIRLEQGAGFQRFEWDAHETVVAAKHRALADGYPVVNERYLLLALLDSNANAIRSLRERLGSTFERVQGVALSRRIMIARWNVTPLFEWGT